MSLTQQKCYICKKLCEVVMTSSQSQYIKLCLDCYIELDTKNKKDFGFPEIKRNPGTHQTKD